MLVGEAIRSFLCSFALFNVMSFWIDILTTRPDTYLGRCMVRFVLGLRFFSFARDPLCLYICFDNVGLSCFSL